MRPWIAAMVVASGALACVVPPAPPPPLPAADAGCSGGGDGYADPPASGVAWVIDRMEVSAEGQGLDVTGDGVPDTAMNAAFGFLRYSLNGALRSTIENGRILYVVEVAGLCTPYRGEDPDATVKIYDCEDANGDTSDNFCRDPGCGAMRVSNQEWTADGQPTIRSQPTPVTRFQLNAAVSGTFGVDMDDLMGLAITNNRLALTIPELLDEIPDGWLCGAVAARELDEAVPPHQSDPECRSLCWPDDAPDGLSLAGYLASRGFQPDLDLDGDGLERYQLDSNLQVARCYDGPQSATAPRRWGADCLHDPRMADAFSVCFALHAVRAQLLLE